MQPRRLKIALVLLAHSACGSPHTQVPADAGVTWDAAEPDAQNVQLAPCDPNPVCPTPQANHTSVCGTIVHADTGTPLSAPELRQIQLDVRSDLSTIVTIAEITECAQYSAVDFPTPPLQALVVVSDRDSEGRWVTTPSDFPPAAGQALDDLTVLAISSEVDAQWSECAFGAGAPTFAERGSTIVVFENGSQPQEGVTVTNVPADSVFYLTGSTPILRQCPSSTAPTAPNGSVLVTNGTQGVNATGGIPSNCVWQPLLVPNPSGILKVHRHSASCQ